MIEHYKRLQESLDHFGEKCFSKGYISSSADKFINKLSYRNTHIDKHSPSIGQLFDETIFDKRATTYTNASDSAFTSDMSCKATVIDFIQNNTKDIYEKMSDMLDGEAYAFDCNVKDMKNKSIQDTNAIAFKKDNKAGIINACACDQARIVLRKRSEAEFGFVIETAYPVTLSMHRLPQKQEQQVLQLATNSSKICQRDFMAKAYIESCTNGNQLPNSCYKKPDNFENGYIQISKTKRGPKVPRPHNAKGAANIDYISIYADASISVSSKRGWKPCEVSPYAKGGSTPFVYLNKNKAALQEYIKQDPKFGRAEITSFDRVRNIIRDMRTPTRESVAQLDTSQASPQVEKSL